MGSYPNSLKEQAIELRKRGYLYSEIERALGRVLPKSTLYYWFRNIELSVEGNKRLENLTAHSLIRAQEASIISRRESRRIYFSEKEERNAYLLQELSNDSVRKLLLATLYLAEGTKRTRGGLVFGNSDPGIIKMFLTLFRESFSLDESKFRCTVQGRGDQDFPGLERFWSDVTNIPPPQFYKARIDSRSIGKISKKKEYKGVCRIDYLSSDLLYELMVIGSMLKQGP